MSNNIPSGQASDTLGSVPPAPQAPEKTVPPFLWLLLIGAINLTVPFLPVTSRWMAVIVSVLVTGVYVGAFVSFGLGVALGRQQLGILAAVFAGAALVWLGFEYGINPEVARLFRSLREANAEPTTGQKLLYLGVTSAQDLAMMSGGVLGGALLARLIRHPNMVGPIGVIVALIDTWGVLFQGPVYQLLNNDSTKHIAAKAMAAGPQVGALGGKASKFAVRLPDIGIGDFLFVGLLLSVLVNLNMNWRTPARAMTITVVLALLSLTFFPFLPPLPGLIFIGLSAVLPNLKYFRFTREEKFALLYAGILVLVLTAAVYFLLMAYLAGQAPTTPG